MFMRAVTIRIVYLGALTLGVLLSAALRQSDVSAAPLQASAPQRGSDAVSATPVLLPTIHVRAQASRPAVPATAPAAKVAMAPVAQDHAVQPDTRGGVSLPALRMDMPYYSFGKLLPRVGKE